MEMEDVKKYVEDSVADTKAELTETVQELKADLAAGLDKDRLKAVVRETSGEIEDELKESFWLGFPKWYWLAGAGGVVLVIGLVAKLVL